LEHGEKKKMIRCAILLVYCKCLCKYGRVSGRGGSRANHGFALA
jgi:hypothetical protein